MIEETAEILAYKAMGHIMSDDSLRDRFLAMSGFDENTIVQSVQQRHFQISVLEFFVSFEPDLIVLAETENIPPQDITKAWRTLGGGVGQEW